MSYHDYSRIPISKAAEPHFQLEDILGRKKRVNYLIDRRNKINLSTLGDKPYKSPEFSADFFKLEGAVIKMRYGIPLKKYKLKVRDQLGQVAGIFTTFMKLPPIALCTHRKSLDNSEIFH